MKYIRTKDGIYENNTNFSEKTLKEVSSGLIEVIKQADTIEELCDEFVIIFPDGTWETYNMFGVLEDCLKMDYYKGCKYYGAIWTDKGLIYVAKMNDNGELELL